MGVETKHSPPYLREHDPAAARVLRGRWAFSRLFGFGHTMVIFLTLCSVAWAEDWQLHRPEYDPRIVARFKGILTRNPLDTYALTRLLTLYQKHRTVAALLTEMKALAQRRPGDYGPQAILGGLYQKTGKIELAIQCFRRAAELNPKVPALPLMLGTLLRKQNQPQEAKKAYEHALALSRRAAQKKRILRALASLALEVRDFSAARAHYEQLTVLEPRNVMLRLELAQALAQNGQEKEAVEQYQFVLQKTRDSAKRAEVLKEIGSLQTKLGQELQAVATYRQAMALTAPGHWLRRELTELIIAIYRQREDLKGLIDYYEKTWPHKGFFEYDVLGRLYFENNDEPNALASYHAALKAAPYAVDTRLRLIDLLARSGREEEVILQYRKLVAVAPGEPKYQLELAKRLHRAGRQEEALNVLDGCSRRFTGDASVHAVLADLYARWGHQARAMKEAQTLVSIEPNDPAHIINLGEQLFIQGKKRRAIETWKRLLSTISERHAALAKLAEVYGQHEMIKESIDLYRRAIKLSPKTITYSRDLALLLERKQRTTDALRAWDDVLRLAKQQNRQDLRQESRTRLIDILHRTYQLRHQLQSYRFHFDAPMPHLESGFLLAEGYAKLGEMAQAEAVYRRILEVEKENLEAMAALERLFRQQRKLKEAVQLLKQMATLEPKNAREYFQRIADLLLQSYRDKEALIYAHKAVALGRQDAGSYRYLGELYEKKEDYQQAMKAYAKAIQLDPQTTKVKFALARLYTQQGQYSAAEKVYRELLQSATSAEVIQQAFKKVIDLSQYLDHLEALERELLSLSVVSPHAEHYRRILVQIYQRRIPLLMDQALQGDRATRARAQAELKRIGIRGLTPLLEELASTSRPRKKLIRMLGFLGNEHAVLPLMRIAQEQPDEKTITVYGPPKGRYGSLFRYAPYRYDKLASQIGRRIEATLAIGRIADAKSVPGLLQLLADQEGGLRDAAAWSLGRIKSESAEQALFQALGDQRSTVQLLACSGLGRQGNPRNAPVLEEVMMDNQRRDEVRAACAWSLGALQSTAAVDSLLQVIKVGDSSLPQCAAWALGMIGDKRAIEPLLRAIWNKRNRVRQTIRWALVQLANQAPLPAPPATTPDIDVKDGRIAADQYVQRLTAMSRQPFSSSEHALLRRLVAMHPQVIAEGLQDALARHRDMILRVLQELDQNEEGLALTPLLVAQEDSTRQKRNVRGPRHKQGAHSVRSPAKEELPPTSQQIDHLMSILGQKLRAPVASLLSHRDALVRQKAISVYIKLRPPEVEQQLKRALHDPDEQVRISALRALLLAHRLKLIKAELILQRLKENLHAPRWTEREVSVEVLGQMQTPLALPALSTALKDDNAYVRLAAVHGLGHTGGPGAISALRGILHDELPHVRAAVCHWLARLDPAQARAMIQPLQHDRSRLVRQAAKETLQRLDRTMAR